MAFREPFYWEITVETKIFWWKYGGLIKTNGCKGWDGAAADQHKSVLTGALMFSLNPENKWVGQTDSGRIYADLLHKNKSV